MNIEALCWLQVLARHPQPRLCRGPASGPTSPPHGARQRLPAGELNAARLPMRAAASDVDNAVSELAPGMPCHTSVRACTSPHAGRRVVCRWEAC